MNSDFSRGLQRWKSEFYHGSPTSWMKVNFIDDVAPAKSTFLKDGSRTLTF